MSIKLDTRTVGPWPMNAYLISCPITKESIIVDPGAEPEVIMDMAGDTRVKYIFLTHGHMDHVGALNEIKHETNAPVFIHPSDAKIFNINYDKLFSDGESIHIGKQVIDVIHTPGHTPGMVSLKLDNNRLIVGDTIFVGGPGRTNSPAEFIITMQTMQKIVFTWPDETVFYPGHGENGNIGNERRSFDRFVKNGWSPKLCGDVTWE